MKTKKLMIKKETLVNLEKVTLNSAKGGTIYLSNLPGVWCSREATLGCTSGDPRFLCSPCEP